MEPVDDGADVLLLDPPMRPMRAGAGGTGGRGVSSPRTLPNHLTCPDAYAAAVLEHVSQHPTPVVVPGGDAAISALRPWRRKLETHTTLALAPEAALDVGTDKG